MSLEQLSDVPLSPNSLDEDDELKKELSEPNSPNAEEIPKKAGRRKINIEFIEDKNRRHITFSKRKAGIMKKAYELSTLTGTQVLLLVASETGHVYTFATPKLQPLITKQEGKNLIQSCLNAPDNIPQSPPHHVPPPRATQAPPYQDPSLMYPSSESLYNDAAPPPYDKEDKHHERAKHLRTSQSESTSKSFPSLDVNSLNSPLNAPLGISGHSGHAGHVGYNSYPHPPSNNSLNHLMPHHMGVGSLYPMPSLPSRFMASSHSSANSSAGPISSSSQYNSSLPFSHSMIQQLQNAGFGTPGSQSFLWASTSNVSSLSTSAGGSDLSTSKSDISTHQHLPEDLDGDDRNIPLMAQKDS
jgi:hypothetical protein